MEATQCATESNENEELEDNASSDFQSSSDFIEMRNSFLLKNIEERRDEDGSLPIMEYREEILNGIQNNQIIVIKGDTGCGKSTQIPQFIFDAYVRQKRGHECNIIVAEPRRVSAISLAHRVAQERKENLGDVVGYHVRFDRLVPEMLGSILYCTTGMLLRKLEHNVKLEGVSHLILDEAHERSIHIDILLKLFKELLKNNSHIKLIIMSATINAGLFQQYFSCPVIDIPGRTYPVKMHFMEDIDLFKTDLSNQSNAVDIEIPFDKVVNLIRWIIKNKPPGAILCFLPGWQEIKQVYTLLQRTELNNLLILSLHSKIPNNIQQRVFVPAPSNVTKVVLATDIAETGITIPDVSYVIDTAIKKDLVFNEDVYSSAMSFRRISRSSISQRKGRAGRVKAGESYHLITRKDYNQLDLHPTPEIFKIPLESSIIISKTFSDETVNDFFGSMIESPSKKVLNGAVENLKNLRILDNDENFTSLGKRVSCFGLDPKLSKAIVLSSIFKCLNPVLLIVTAFSSTNPSLSLDDSRVNTVFREQKLGFHKTSDHIATVKYIRNNNKASFDTSSDNSSIYNTESIERLYMLHVESLLSSRRLLPLDMEAANTYADNDELVRAILFASTNNLIKRNIGAYKRGSFTRKGNTLKTENNESVILKSESVNYNRKQWPSDILTYIHKKNINTNGFSFVSDTSIISPLSVLLFSQGKVTCEKIPDELVEGRDGQILINIENIQNVQFCCKTEIANLLLTFRNIMWDIADFAMEYEGTNTHQDILELVESYKESLMALLSKMLKQSSRNIDNIDDPNN